jgi:hypothetical protein
MPTAVTVPTGQVDARRAQEPRRAVHFLGDSPEVWDLRPETLRNRLIEIGTVLRPHILRLVARQPASDVPTVIEGEGTEPSLLGSLTDSRVRLVFVVEVNENRLAAALANRRSPGAARFRRLGAARQLCVRRMNRLYGEWIEAQALSRGVPCLPSQPWGGSRERIFAAASACPGDL